MDIPYPALFGLHLPAVAMFVAGLTITALLLPALSRVEGLPEARRDEVARLSSMNLYIATPALTLVWICGGGMALEAGWYVAGWLQWKVALVAALSLLHLRQSRALMRLAAGREAKTMGYRPLAIIGCLVIGIGILVIAKPDVPAL